MDIYEVVDRVYPEHFTFKHINYGRYIENTIYLPYVNQKNLNRYQIYYTNNVEEFTSQAYFDYIYEMVTSVHVTDVLCTDVMWRISTECRKYKLDYHPAMMVVLTQLKYFKYNMIEDALKYCSQFQKECLLTLITYKKTDMQMIKYCMHNGVRIDRIVYNMFIKKEFGHINKILKKINRDIENDINVDVKLMVIEMLKLIDSILYKVDEYKSHEREILYILQEILIIYEVADSGKVNILNILWTAIINTRMRVVIMLLEYLDIPFDKEDFYGYDVKDTAKNIVTIPFENKACQ